MDSSSTTLPSSIPEIPMDKLFGSVLIGTFLGLVLYGITLHQFYRYSRMYPSDTMILKVAVLLTVMLETAHVALSCHTCYYFLVSSFFQPEKLGVATHPMEWLPVTSGVIISTSQAFFARRAYIFAKGWYRILVLVAVLCLLGELGFSIVTGHSETSNHSSRVHRHRQRVFRAVCSQHVVDSMRVGPGGLRGHYHNHCPHHCLASESEWYQKHGLVDGRAGFVYYHDRINYESVNALTVPRSDDSSIRRWNIHRDIRASDQAICEHVACRIE